MTEARHLAEIGLRRIAAMQNDATVDPRFLFDPNSYKATGTDPEFKDYTMTDPESSHALGEIRCRIVGGMDPQLDSPPYRVQSTVRIRNSTRTLEAEVGPQSLLEYALWTESNVGIAPYITYEGKVYSAGTITLWGSPVTFHRKVEYVTATMPCWL